MSARRIIPGTEPIEMVEVLTDNHSAAWAICIQLSSSNRIVDPYDARPELSPLQDLDSLGIYGRRIVIFSGEVCRHHIGLMLAVLRANQLGIEIASKGDIDAAIDHGIALDLEAIVGEVRERLPDYDPYR